MLAVNDIHIYLLCALTIFVFSSANGESDASKMLDRDLVRRVGARDQMAASPALSLQSLDVHNRARNENRMHDLVELSSVVRARRHAMSKSPEAGANSHSVVGREDGSEHNRSTSEAEIRKHNHPSSSTGRLGSMQSLEIFPDSSLHRSLNTPLQSSFWRSRSPDPPMSRVFELQQKALPETIGRAVSSPMKAVHSGSLLSFHPLNASNGSSAEASDKPQPVVSNTMLAFSLVLSVVCLAAMVSTLIWIRRSDGEVPAEGCLEEPAVGTITSLPQIWGITTVNIAYGFEACSVAVFLMPKECQFMFPDHPSAALGSVEALVSFSMLIGPVAGRASDSFKNLIGRRRPIIHFAVHAGGLCTLGMWLSSSFRQPVIYVPLLLLQQMMWNGINAAQTALVSDLVEPSRKDVASAIQVASLLGGAILSILTFQGIALQGLDFRLNYLPMIALGWLMLPLTHIAAPEQSSTNLMLPSSLDWRRPTEAVSAVFALGDARSNDFILLTWERGAYYAAAASKVFIFFFLKDGIGVKSPTNQAIFLGEVALVSSCASTLAGMVTFLIFSVMRVRAQNVASFGAIMMAFSSQFWCVHFLGSKDARKMVLLCYIVGFGAGQGCYLAADLALAMATMPDPNEASRYMGFWGLSAFIGGGLGSVMASVLMEVFGKTLPAHLGIAVEAGSYHIYGYVSLLICTFCCDAYVATACYRVRTRDEYNNPQSGQDVELNPQDG